jgi:hypothetical protein
MTPQFVITFSSGTERFCAEVKKLEVCGGIRYHVYLQPAATLNLNPSDHLIFERKPSESGGHDWSSVPPQGKCDVVDSGLVRAAGWAIDEEERIADGLASGFSQQ